MMQSQVQIRLHTSRILPIFENGFVNPTLLEPTVACYDSSWKDAEPGDKVMEGYNTPIEQFMESIRSILNQTYKNLEVILVDDGSTDGSIKICEDWKQKDKRIKIISAILLGKV